MSKETLPELDWATLKKFTNAMREAYEQEDAYKLEREAFRSQWSSDTGTKFPVNPQEFVALCRECDIENLLIHDKNEYDFCLELVRDTLKLQAAPPLSLHSDDGLILRCLNDNHPNRQRVVDIANKTHMGQKNVGARLNSLIEHGLAHRPKGNKAGATITPKGVRLLDQNRGAAK
ncbi:MAG: hypothetical protein ABGX16_05560 [Pirellulales bacterium]